MHARVPAYDSSRSYATVIYTGKGPGAAQWRRLFTAVAADGNMNRRMKCLRGRRAWQIESSMAIQEPPPPP